MPIESSCELYILPSAFEEIKSHIEWRVQSAENRYEQGGILIGDVYKDPVTRIAYGLVRSVIPSPRSGDETYIQFTQESWLEMYKALDRKKAVASDGGQMRILGWYHTHPNMRVLMSAVDQNTHRQFFSKYWQFSVIFNPQRGIWSVFNGPDCFNCRGKLFCSQADYNKKPYITDVSASSANSGWRYFPQDRVENRTNRAEGGTRGAENREERKTFHITSRTAPPLPSPPASRQPDAAPVRRPKAQRRTQNDLPSVPRGSVIKNAAQTLVNAVLPPERFIYSKRLYQRSNEIMLVIQREFAEQFVGKATLPNYITEKNELILLYPLTLQNNPYQYEGELYYSFENRDGGALKATGFWYITDSGQYVEYMERERPSDRVNLAVVYSNRPADEKKLRDWHEVSAMCDCVLWLNLRNPNQTRFYALPRGGGTYPLLSRFPRGPECSALRKSEDMILESYFSSRVQNNWIYFDDSTNDEADCRKISPDFIQRLFERLRCSQMRSDCCVAVTYGAGFDPLDENAITLLNEPFLTIRVLSPRLGSVDVDADFFNTPYSDSAVDGKPKFVFLFSGGNIDVQQAQKRLVGRDSALVLNIEDAQHFRLCRLFRTDSAATLKKRER